VGDLDNQNCFTTILYRSITLLTQCPCGFRHSRDRLINHWTRTTPAMFEWRFLWKPSVN